MEPTPNKEFDAWAEAQHILILLNLTSGTALTLVLLLASASGTSKRVAVLDWSQNAQPRYGEECTLAAELQKSLSSQ